eukprot:1740698-Rhodomonas_salina.3
MCKKAGRCHLCSSTSAASRRAPGKRNPCISTIHHMSNASNDREPLPSPLFASSKREWETGVCREMCPAAKNFTIWVNVLGTGMQVQGKR